MSQRTWEILAFIKRFSRERGYPPTIREIGVAFEISSTNGVRYHLGLLEKSGHLTRRSKLSRGIEAVGTALEDAPEEQGIPILGRVAAGRPILAEESLDGHLDLGQMFGHSKGMFALRVRGDSMIEAGIFEDDYVIVRSQKQADAGQVVVAMLEGEATVKYYRPRGSVIELVAANPNYDPIRVDGNKEFGILGVVKGVVRTLGR